MSTNDANENFRFITDIFIKFVERHAPLTKRFVTENQFSFINKESRKVIHIDSLGNNFAKVSTKKMKKITK